MSPVASVGVVLVLSRLLLISQAVGAALRGRGIAADAAAWSEGLQRATEDLTENDLVLLFDDLEDRDSVLAAQALVTRSPAQFLVLTHRPEGAAWGAMLSAGAAAVMPNESSLAAVETAVRMVGTGRSPFSDVRRSRLVREWFHWLEEDDALRGRMADLSPREREVLELLSQGFRVGDIVDRPRCRRDDRPQPHPRDPPQARRGLAARGRGSGAPPRRPDPRHHRHRPPGAAESQAPGAVARSTDPTRLAP